MRLDERNETQPKTSGFQTKENILVCDPAGCLRFFFLPQDLSK
jgi:hypothetical protein